MVKKIKFKIYFVMAGIFLAGFIAYSNILNAPFVFDDDYYIVNNPEIRDLSNFKDTYGTRYVGFLSFAINYYFNGLNTFGYHLVNIVIHILNAILVYYFVRFTFETGIGKGIGEGKEKNISLPISLPDFIAFAVSLIFLVHPIQTESVTYISQRFESLAAFFYLLAIVLYVKARLKGQEVKRLRGKEVKPFNLFAFLSFYLLSLLSAILAMKTKEISFTLPFIIILYEFTFFKNNGHGSRSRFLYLLPYLLMLIIIPLNVLVPEKGLIDELRSVQIEDITELSKYEYFITELRVIVTYIKLLILPINQNLDHDYPVYKTFFEPAVILSFIFILTIFYFAIYLYLRSWTTRNANGLLISFGIFWFFITLSVTSSVIPTKDVIFEHRLYLPGIGFILSAVTFIFYGFEYLEQRFGRSLFIYVLVVILGISLSFLSGTIKRNIAWGSEERIWQDTVNKSPGKARPHNYLASVYEKTGRIDEAVKEVRIALSLPSALHHNHYYNLGLGLKEKGLFSDAVGAFLEAVKLKPDYWEAYYHLGLTYVEIGRLEDAEENIKKALELQQLKSGKSDLHDDLGNIYLMQGKYQLAINEYEKAVNLDKNNVEAIYNIAMAYENIGSKDKSIEFYKKFIEMSHPDYENEKERAKTRIKELTKND